MFWKKKNKPVEVANGGSSPAMPEHPAVKVIIKTDLGNVRTNNEDSASFLRIAEAEALREKGNLLIVADGMGGHLAGEVASKMAVDIIGEEYFKHAKANKEEILSKAFTTANKKIFHLSSSNEQYKGMGTTCTALVIVGETVYFAHAGDSRAYLYKNATISRITEDHTYVQELVRTGAITAAEADTHPQRNILTNAMGTKNDLRVDTGKCPLPFEPGDRVMICSDGLYDYLSDTEIGEVMAYSSLQDAADYFISEAKRRGGMDNITVVLGEAGRTEKNDTLKTTREAGILKMTRDADLPADITRS